MQHSRKDGVKNCKQSREPGYHCPDCADAAPYLLEELNKSERAVWLLEDALLDASNCLEAFAEEGRRAAVAAEAAYTTLRRVR